MSPNRTEQLSDEHKFDSKEGSNSEVLDKGDLAKRGGGEDYKGGDLRPPEKPCSRIENFRILRCPSQND